MQHLALIAREAGLRELVAEVGRAAHGYAARDWRANFFPVGIAHSIVGGSAWEPTPWRAVQRAGWAAIRR